MWRANAKCRKSSKTGDPERISSGDSSLHIRSLPVTSSAMNANTGMCAASGHIDPLPVGTSSLAFSQHSLHRVELAPKKQIIFEDLAFQRSETPRQVDILNSLRTKHPRTSSTTGHIHVLTRYQYQAGTWIASTSPEEAIHPAENSKRSHYESQIQLQSSLPVRL